MVMTNKDKGAAETDALVKLRNKMVFDITQRLEQFNLNTVISGFMEYNNKFLELTKTTGVDLETLRTMVLLIAPFAPHIGEELWEQLGGEDSVFHHAWPSYSEDALKEDEKEIAVQINGKTRVTVNISVNDEKDVVIAKAKESLGSRLTGNIIKEIYVPGKIVNIVVK